MRCSRQQIRGYCDDGMEAPPKKQCGFEVVMELCLCDREMTEKIIAENSSSHMNPCLHRASGLRSLRARTLESTRGRLLSPARLLEWTTSRRRYRENALARRRRRRSRHQRGNWSPARAGNSFLQTGMQAMAQRDGWA